jgi:hypothetical protein
MADTCNGSGADAMSGYFALADPVTFNTSGTRHFATDTRGTIFQDNTDNALTEPLTTNPPAIVPVQ